MRTSLLPSGLSMSAASTSTPAFTLAPRVLRLGRLDEAGFWSVAGFSSLALSLAGSSVPPLQADALA